MKIKPNFKEMNRQELRAYILAHRDEEEAFFAYMDQLHQDPNRVTYPPLASINDLANYPELFQKSQQESEE